MLIGILSNFNRRNSLTSFSPLPFTENPRKPFKKTSAWKPFGSFAFLGRSLHSFITSSRKQCFSKSTPSRLSIRSRHTIRRTDLLQLFNLVGKRCIMWRTKHINFYWIKNKGDIVAIKTWALGRIEKKSFLREVLIAMNTLFWETKTFP